MTMKTVVLFLSVAGCAFFAPAADFYADANFGDDTWNGKAETKAGINLYTLETLIPAVRPYLGKEFFIWGNHEQCFHRDYLAYQPEYSAKVLKENGGEHFFLEELAAER